MTFEAGIGPGAFGGEAGSQGVYTPSLFPPRRDAGPTRFPPGSAPLRAVEGAPSVSSWLWPRSAAAMSSSRGGPGRGLKATNLSCRAVGSWMDL